MSKHLDVHQAVTNTIVAAIERGVGEWKIPWHRGNGLSFIPTNIEGHSYHGVNCISLFCSALNKSYGTNTWGSFRQLQDAGLQVRKGEKASIVVFYKSITVEPDDAREDDDGTRRVLKHYSVFNVEQCDGWVPKVAPPLAPAFERLDHAERVFGATGATVVVGAAIAPAMSAMPISSRCRMLVCSTATWNNGAKHFTRPWHTNWSIGPARLTA